MERTSSNALFSLSIDPVTKTHLTEIAKWAKFLAIIGIIVLLFLLIGTVLSVTVYGIYTGFDANEEYGSAPVIDNSLKIGALLGSVIFLALAFFPLLFLLRFANAMQHSLSTNDQHKLNTSFQNLKIYFRYLGIVTLIILIIYGLIFTMALLGSFTS